MKVALVAGEHSGDTLGAGLLRELRQRLGDIEVRGIAGPRCQAEGAVSLYPMDDISIMGLDGLFGNIRKILGIRASLYRQFVDWKPDIFVGIDVPDFNLSLESRLRRAGIPTVHYVSPTVWAWRRYRIRRIRRAVSHMLTLFPFEEDFYREHDVPVTFVGHPLADALEVVPMNVARQRLGLAPEAPVVALLPGSRASEIGRLGRLFAETAGLLAQDVPGVRFVVPCAGDSVRDAVRREVVERVPGSAVTLVEGRAQLVLQAADVALLASGTAALEAALCRVPMVVAYRVSSISYLMVRLFSSVKHYSMPNHLLEHPIVPEFIQDDARVEQILPVLRELLVDAGKNRGFRQALDGLAATLARGADRSAAEAVIRVAGEAA